MRVVEHLHEVRNRNKVSVVQVHSVAVIRYHRKDIIDFNGLSCLRSQRLREAKALDLLDYISDGVDVCRSFVSMHLDREVVLLVEHIISVQFPVSFVSELRHIFRHELLKLICNTLLVRRELGNDVLYILIRKDILFRSAVLSLDSELFL